MWENENFKVEGGTSHRDHFDKINFFLLKYTKILKKMIKI